MSSPPLLSAESPTSSRTPSNSSSTVESSPFFDQILLILVILRSYPELEDARATVCTLAAHCNRALELVKLEHEQILLGQNLTRLVASATDLSSTEVRLLINELNARAHKTEGFANQLNTDFSLSTPSLQRTSSLAGLKSMVENFRIQLKSVHDYYAHRKNFMANLQGKYTNALADGDELEKLRNLILSVVQAFSAEDQNRLQEAHVITLAGYVQLGNHVDDSLKRVDEKLSQHVVDLVLEWNRNQKKEQAEDSNTD